MLGYAEIIPSRTLADIGSQWIPLEKMICFFGESFPGQCQAIYNGDGGRDGVGGIPTPLKNMKVSLDDYSQYMEK